MQSIGMSSFLRSAGDCRISRSGAGELRMSHGLTYSYLAKKSSMSQTRSLTSGRCGMGSTVITSACTCAQVGLAGEPVAPVDVHRAGAADGGAAAVAEGERAVEVLLDVEEALEHGEAGLVGHDEVVVARRALGVARRGRSA